MNRPDEDEIIRIFQTKFGLGKSFVPEDIEYFTLKRGEKTVYIKSDMLNERTDTIPQMPLEHVARKSVASCVSDFVSKGVRPKYANLVVAIPPYFTVNEIKELSKGFNMAKKEFGITFLGGDVNEGRELGISVTILGTANKNGKTTPHIERGGAKNGELIITTGPFGYTGSALKLIYEKNPKVKLKKHLQKKFFEQLFLPMINVEGLLKISKFFTSSMDSSDGLSTTLNEMSQQSKKRFIIDKLPTTEDVTVFAYDNNYNLQDLVFNGGEEYHVVATVSPKDYPKLSRLASKHNIELYNIGKVTTTTASKTAKKTKTHDKGGVYLNKKGRMVRIERRGWVHLRKTK